MKTSPTKLKSSFFILLTLTALPLWAKPVAQVTGITGQVFVITALGETSTLKMNDHLEEKSEVMVEEGGAITLNDYYDATYHLVGGTHLKFFNKSVQLKRGKAWIQSLSERHSLALTTANGHVDYWKGEFITTFNQDTSRSQVLVVNGDVEVSNVLDRNMKYTVPAGSFSVIDPEVESGLPRAPTKVGLTSLNSALAEFKKLPKESGSNRVSTRSIASVTEAPEAKVKKGEIIFISTNRLPASVQGKAHNYYKKNATKGAKLSHVPIKFYGTTWKESAVEMTPRSPASVPVRVQVPRKTSRSLNLDPEFTESLKKEMNQQPKYSKELEGLIHDLKSY
jgi:hypothetical protein